MPDEWSFPLWLRRRRAALRLTQAEVAARAGIARSNYCAIEAGKRPVGAALRATLEAALDALPGDILYANREAVRQATINAGFVNPRVFGSCARYEDTSTSDVDLLVAPAPGKAAGLSSVVRLQAALERILATPVDLVVESTRPRPVTMRAMHEAVAL